MIIKEDDSQGPLRGCERVQSHKALEGPVLDTPLSQIILKS